jgi:mannitol 2-dehydrogenase
VAVPAYDRASVTVGVVHIGVGNFHRAHQALFLDRLMELTGDLSWGVCGVGVLPRDRAMRDALEAQDYLYTLVEKHDDGTEQARVVGSIVDYMFSPEDPAAVVERMSSEAVRMVTLTITEGAYAPESETPGPVDYIGAPPRTAFALMADALRLRRERGIEPFSVVSCDNLPGNGRLTRARLVAFTAKDDAELSEWIEREVPFPNSMVDRITTATTDRDRAELAERYGIRDRWPVVCEGFLQWVLEDASPASRPPLEKVGVQIVDAAAPYERMKLRLLNGAHQLLGYLAYVAGHRLVDEAVRDEPFRELLIRYMNEEAAPTLGPLPGVDVEVYTRTLIERFGNTGVRDTLARLCQYASDRIPTFLLPVVRAQLEAGGEIRHAVLGVAGWARYAEGIDDADEPIEVDDERAVTLKQRAVEARTDPRAFIQDEHLFGDLVDSERFAAEFEAALTSLHERGARATVEALIRAPKR